MKKLRTHWNTLFIRALTDVTHDLDKILLKVFPLTRPEEVASGHTVLLFLACIVLPVLFFVHVGVVMVTINSVVKVFHILTELF